MKSPQTLFLPFKAGKRGFSIATLLALVLTLFVAPTPANAALFPSANFGTTPAAFGAGVNSQNATIWMKTVNDSSYNLNDGALLEVQLGGATVVSGQECATSNTWVTTSSCPSISLAITLPGNTALATPANTKYRYFDNSGVATIQIELAYRAAISYPVGTTFSITIAPGAITWLAGPQALSLYANSISGGNINNANRISDAYYVNPVVTFNANGGSGTMPNQIRGTAGNLTTNAFTRSGYTFAGWNTVANGTGGTPYADGASYAFVNNLELHAQWTLIPVAASTTKVPVVVLGPEIHSSTPRVFDQGVAQTLVIAGQRFDDLVSASLAGASVSIISATNELITLAIPAQSKLGTQDLVLKFKKGNAIFQEVFTVVDPAVAKAAAANRLPKPEPKQVIKTKKTSIKKAVAKKKK